MKKRNWVLECMICALVLFFGFGIYMTLSRDNVTFELEDLQGDRSYLSDFPLEGYGGGDGDSFRFTILNGELDVEYYPYTNEQLANMIEAEKYGLNGFEGLFNYTPPENDVYCHTTIVAAEDANVRELNQSYTHKLAHRNSVAGVPGATITMDAAAVFAELDYWKYLERKGSGWSGEYIGARVDTGLVLRDKTYFYTNEDHSSYISNNYTEQEVGEKESKHLETFHGMIGDDLYIVTAPDERCEGQTYVFKVTMVDYEDVQGDLYHDNDYNMKLQQRAYNREEQGVITPLIPVPDFAECRIVGLDVIAERELLILYKTERNTLVAEIYDTEGNLLDSCRTELTDESEKYENDAYEYVAFHIAHEVRTSPYTWEEGTSVDISVGGYMEAVENDDQYGGTQMTTGNLLLWIDRDGTIEQVNVDENKGTPFVREDKILYLKNTANEKLKEVYDIYGYGTLGEDRIEVCDKNSGETLYLGRLKTNFWQDELEGLAEIDNAKKSGYIKDSKRTTVGSYEFDRHINITVVKSQGVSR